MCVTHQNLNHEDYREVDREEAHAALLALYADRRLADEGQVDEAAVGVAEGEAEQLHHERVLVFCRGAMVFEVFLFLSDQDEPPAAKNDEVGTATTSY